ncbi:uncharacterized protein [Narcine bancroftii]|uniref:uncharacterized protein n=1 Tax=Narcine bancroftii TaxID=1343680 RepID=UPI0038321962
MSPWDDHRADPFATSSRWHRAIVVTLLLLTGDLLAATSSQGPQELYGFEGRALDFGSVYEPGAQRHLHSLTCKLQRQITRRIFQYLFSDSEIILTASYSRRVRFSPTTGSLQILNFTAMDAGTYLIILTDHQGLEITTPTSVRAYEKLSGLVIREHPSEANSSLTCAATHGTQPLYRWLKDGESVERIGQVALSKQGQRLTLLSANRILCGVYTCTARNQISTQSANFSLTESDGFAFCTGHRRNIYTCLIVIGVFAFLGLITTVLWVRHLVEERRRSGAIWASLCNSM